MSLYLQITVGAGRYLLAAAGIIEIRAAVEGAGAPDGLAIVDLRQLFGEPAGTGAAAVLMTQLGGGAAGLIADRADDLVDLDEAEFCPLPPIGPLGTLFDAMVARLVDGHPMLRLRGERALAAAAAIGC